MTADEPRRFDAGRAGVGLGLALGLALIAFASGGYFRRAGREERSSHSSCSPLLVGGGCRPSASPSSRSAGSPGSARGPGSRCSGRRHRGDRARRPARAAVRGRLYGLSGRRSNAHGAARPLGDLHGDLPRLRLRAPDEAVPGTARRLRHGRHIPPRGAADVLERARRLRGDGCAARARLRDRGAVARGARALRRDPSLLFATVYFTFSRGAWIAGAVGLAVGVAVDPRRLQLLADPSRWPCRRRLRSCSSQADALTRTDAARGCSGRRATTRCDLILLAKASCSPARSSGSPSADRAVAAGEARLRGRPRAGGGRVLLAVFIRYGDPVTLARKGYDSFHDGLPRESGEPQHEAALVLRELPNRALERRLA